MTQATYRILQTLHQADVSAFLRVSHWPSITSWQIGAKWVSRSADGWLYPLIPLLIAAHSPDIALQFFYVMALSYILERLMYFLLKKSIKRNRPPIAIPGFNSVIQASDEFSFPSGHTSAAFLATTVLVLFFPASAFSYLYLWSASVALSRVLLGVHFPMDTLAGAILGSSTAFLIFTLFNS